MYILTVSTHVATDTHMKDKTLQMRVSDEFLEKLDNWRNEQKVPPPRSEAIRFLVDLGLKSDGNENE